MKTILLVDDDRLMCDRIRTLLGRFGFQVEAVHTFEDGYKRACGTPYALFLIDLCLGTDHGILLIKQLRALKNTAPILVWTAQDPVLFESRSLDAGADGFISKDTAPDCVISRINAQLRREEWRNGWKPSSTRHIALGPAVLDRAAHTLELAENKVIKITKRETDILDLLAVDRHRVLSAREILKRVWGASSLQTDNAVHAVMKRLRKKLEGHSELQDLIEGHPGRGYRFSQREMTLSLTI
jgi:DNA-binding response OmpR family regulator